MIPVSRLLTLALAATAVGCGHHRCACKAPGGEGERHGILSASPAPAGQAAPTVTTGRQSGASHTTDEPPQILPGSAAAEPPVLRELADIRPAGQGGASGLEGVSGAAGQIVDPDGQVLAPVVIVTRDDPPADLSRVLAAAATVPEGPSLIIPAFADAAEEPAEPVIARRRTFSVQVTTGAPMQVATPAPLPAETKVFPMPAAVPVAPAASVPEAGGANAPLPEHDPNCRQAHAADYSWVVGELRYLHTRKCWQVRYAPVEVEDDYGGSFLLTGVDHLAAGFREGQVVKVNGVVLRPERHGASTVYWVDGIKHLR